MVTELLGLVRPTGKTGNRIPSPFAEIMKKRPNKNSSVPAFKDIPELFKSENPMETGVENQPDEPDAFVALDTPLPKVPFSEAGLAARFFSLERRVKLFEGEKEKWLAKLEEIKRREFALEKDSFDLEKSKRHYSDQLSRLESLDSLERSIADRSISLKCREQELSKIEREHEQAIDRSKDQSEQLKALKRELSRSERQLNHLEKLVSKRGASSKLIELAVQYPAQGFDFFNRAVVVVGNGPLDDWEITNFLIDLGIDVYEPGSEDVECMIIGDNSFSEEQIEKQIAVQEGETLRVFSQELALASILSQSDMLEHLPKKLLKGLAEVHDGLSFLQKGDLCWPLTKVKSLPQSPRYVRGEKGRVEESPIKKMGYTVGKSSGL